MTAWVLAEAVPGVLHSVPHSSVASDSKKGDETQGGQGGGFGGAVETTTQVITVVATLSGAVLTFLANSYLERRRGRDARELETIRRAAEHAHWLRDERLNAYAQLSIAGEEALQFIRSELPLLATPSGREQRAAAESCARHSARPTTELLSSPRTRYGPLLTRCGSLAGMEETTTYVTLMTPGRQLNRSIGASEPATWPCRWVKRVTPSWSAAGKR